MKRRVLLQRTTALAAAGATAGCLAGGADVGSGGATTTSTRTTTDSSTTTTTERPEESFETLRVGSRDGVIDPQNNKPHAVTVTNAADEPRTIEVRVRRSGENPVLRTWSREFPAGGRLRVELLTPGEYAVTVTVGGERAGQVSVDRPWFDCNSSATHVTVTGDGTVESRTISTAMGCMSSVREASLRVTDSGCWTEGEAESAAVTFGDGTLGVDGTFRVPSPDYGLGVTGAEWVVEGGRRTLVVTVATTDAGQVGGGVQCIGAVEYEATLTVDGGLPGRVVVRHRSPDGAEDVASVDRESTTTTGE